jgi:septum formation protein
VTRPRLVLASASPRRLDLLRQIGLAPDAVAPSDIDETVARAELPRDHARRLARGKAEAARATLTDDGASWILAADTVVSVGRRILPKAESEAEARLCLDLLSGRAHRVQTAICLSLPDGRLRERIVESRVGFKRLAAPEVDSYLGSGEWRGKAGAYAIQGRAAAFVTGLVGSYSAVVGLPLFEVSTLLEGEGFPVRAGWGEGG